jgi:thiol-disulfide isomerase/thioredoxin
MFRPPGAGPAAPIPQSTTSDALLQSVAARASGSQLTPPPRSTDDATLLTAPLQIATNPATLKSIISRHKATAVFFTSATCPPCKVIEPIFEDLAYSKASAGVAFVKVDLGVGMGSAAAGEYGVRATPTFIFFNDGKKVCSLLELTGCVTDFVS